MARTILGIIAGDLIFAGSAVLLFYIARVDPHAPASLRFMICAILYGVAFALLSGYVAGLISRRADLIAGMILAAIIAISAFISLLARPGQGAVWTQISTLLFSAPAILVGDRLRTNR
jgi:uncharacterized oligopeptide transporter (OPT) family protein